MAFQQYFPVGASDLVEWDHWNGALAVYYSQEHIVFSDEANWKETAYSLNAMPTFTVFPLPDPDAYDDWRAWATEFTQIINGKSH